MNRRLWQAAGLLALFVVTASLLDTFFGGTARLGGEHLGQRFVAHYTAGAMAGTGNANLLYSLPHVDAFQQQLASHYGLAIAPESAVWLQHPVAALAVAPLASLSFPWALSAWWLLSAGALGGAMVILAGWLRSADAFAGGWRAWGPLPLLVLLSVPCIQAFGQGSGVFLALLVLAGVVAAWRRDRPMLAGGLCGLLAMSPIVMLLPAVVLVLTCGRRAFAGLALAVSATLAVCLWMPPGVVSAWYTQAPANLTLVQTATAYPWDHQVTLVAFWRLLLQGFTPASPTWQVLVLTGCAVLSLGGALAAAVIRHARDVAGNELCRDTANAADTTDNPWTFDTAATRRDRLITATLLCAPALSPLWHGTGLLLLAVPATLFAAEQLGRAPGMQLSATDTWCRRLWVLMFAWLAVGPVVAAFTYVHLTPVLVASLAALHVKRALWPAATLPAVFAAPAAVNAADASAGPDLLPERIAA